ncbi:MAG: DUF2079 domain-containing protein [Sandaracinaceae bacterium]|nr:DUF2079 domain-containing protein [Sandaracinaceae bacterium]
MRRLVFAAWPPVLVFGAMGYLRFRSVHNQTFDLAFYARMAYGLSRGDLYDPIMGAHVLGLHASPVLVPLGFLGMLFGTVPVLLLAQTLSAGLAAQALAELGMRRLGPWGALAGLVFALHPNVSHVLSYEFHPSTLALAPLVWCLAAVDQRDARKLGWATLAVLACREDLAAVTALTGALAWWLWRPAASLDGHHGQRVALAVALGSLLYLVLWVGVIIPRFAPVGGSVDQHFGHLGGSLVSAVLALFAQPGEVLSHLGQPEKASFLPRVLAPLLLLPLLSPARLLPAAPVLAMLLLSRFPTTSELRTHYLTPALPAVSWAGIHGLARLDAWWGADGERRRAWARRAVGATSVVAYVLGGCGPGALPCRVGSYVDDDATHAARQVLASIPEGASVQAPDALLPHLAERRALHRAAPPERQVDFAVFDVSHRARYVGQGTLLRTAEEPVVRAFMAREDRGVRLYAPPYVLLERGRDPRSGLGPFLDEASGPVARREQDLTACLAVTHGTRLPTGDGVRLHLVAHGPCPSDLALRVGEALPLRRVTLLFEGALSPAVLRAGDRVTTDVTHLSVAPSGTPERASAPSLHVGALRSSGARPEPHDPVAVTVPIVPR